MTPIKNVFFMLVYYFVIYLILIENDMNGAATHGIIPTFMRRDRGVREVPSHEVGT